MRRIWSDQARPRSLSQQMMQQQPRMRKRWEERQIPKDVEREKIPLCWISGPGQQRLQRTQSQRPLRCSTIPHQQRERPLQRCSTATRRWFSPRRSRLPLPRRRRCTPQRGTAGDRRPTRGASACAGRGAPRTGTQEKTRDLRCLRRKKGSWAHVLRRVLQRVRWLQGRDRMPGPTQATLLRPRAHALQWSDQSRLAKASHRTDPGWPARQTAPKQACASDPVPSQQQPRPLLLACARSGCGYGCQKLPQRMAALPCGRGRSAPSRARQRPGGS